VLLLTVLFSSGLCLFQKSVSRCVRLRLSLSLSLSIFVCLCVLARCRGNRVVQSETQTRNELGGTSEPPPIPLIIHQDGW
jgi:hypothetical protein